MIRKIKFDFKLEGIVAIAQLLDDAAPKTCDLIWSLLPIEGYYKHAIYSGRELALVIPTYYPYVMENATTTLLPWEIFFVALRAEDYLDVEQDFSEIAFFYDRNTGPRMLDGLVSVNIFARFISGHAALATLGRRIPDEGRKWCQIRKSRE